jgi:hypothetical protein
MAMRFTATNHTAEIAEPAEKAFLCDLRGLRG